MRQQVNVIKTGVPYASIRCGAIWAADKTQLLTFGKLLQILWAISDAVNNYKIVFINIIDSTTLNIYNKIKTIITCSDITSTLNNYLHLVFTL